MHSERQSGERVAIAGAGIGGLTAALSLAQRGFKISVYEKSAKLEEVGAGIQLSPNAFRILDMLGLGGTLRSYIAEPDSIVVREGADGREIVRMPLQNAQARWGAPYAVIHRADLQKILLDAVLTAGVSVHLSSAVETVSSVGRFESDGAWQDADVVIGADGLWSIVREGFAESYPPHFAGRRAWRTTLPASHAPEWLRENETGLWLGPGAHLVHYPVRGGAEVNLVAIGESRDSSYHGDGPFSEPTGALLKQFDGWTKDVRDLLTGIPGWRSWPLFSGRPTGTIVKGNLALLGDAAHAMLPFLAQGGAMAIEDAAVLTACLTKNHMDIPSRLAAYSAARLPRVTRVQAEAVKNGERYHWSGPKAGLRNIGMRLLGGKDCSTATIGSMGGAREVPAICGDLILLGRPSIPNPMWAWRNW